MIVPFVQKSYGFLGTVLGQLSVIISVNIHFLVGNIRIDKGLDQSSSSPANIVTYGIRDQLICIRTEKRIFILFKRDQHLFKLFCRRRCAKSQCVKPVLTDKSINTVINCNLSFNRPDRAVYGIFVPIDIGFAKPIPQIGQFGLIILHITAEIENSSHLGISKDRRITVRYTDIRSRSCRKQVVDLLHLSPAGHLYEFHLNIVVFQHSLLDVLSVHIVGRIGTAVVTTVVDLNCNVPGLCKLAVYQLTGRCRISC